MTSINYNTLNKIQKFGIGGFGVLTVFQILSPEFGFVLGTGQLLAGTLGITAFCLKDRRIPEIQKIYQEIINDYNKINRDFNFKSPVEVGSLFRNVYLGGYLSKDKKFVLAKENVSDVVGMFGVNIINGEGVCRHLSTMLNDIYKDYGMDSKFLPVVYNCSSNENSIDDRKREILANHIVNLVIYNDNCFIVDPTNFGFYKLNRENTNYLESNRGNNILIDWDSFKFVNGFKASQTRKDILLPNTTYEEDNKVILNVRNLYKDNLDIFDKFYNEHKDGYEELTNKFMKVKK